VEPSSNHILLVAELDGVVSAYAYTTIELLYTNSDSAQLQELAVNTPAAIVASAAAVAAIEDGVPIRAAVFGSSP
jgi:hypothetical protein